MIVIVTKENIRISKNNHINDEIVVTIMYRKNKNNYSKTMVTMIAGIIRTNTNC